jgi:cytochrome c oxidase assembly protein subunit 11
MDLKQQARQQRLGRNNARMLGKLMLIAVLMFGFGYSLVPLYKRICELTGINVLAVQETKAVEAVNTQIDKSRMITVEFDASGQGPWRFRPTVNSLQVHPGEMAQIVYEVVNTQDRIVNAQAIPSYAPQEAAAYFRKLDCFCFKQQTLAANEARQMPVSFYIDPAVPKNVKTITLSYTFFEVGGTLKKAS